MTNRTARVTLLFTDVAGSTAAWEADPPAMAIAMARHDLIVDRAARASGGQLIKPRGEGDSSFLVYDRPVDAVRAAAAIVRQLREEDWPTAQPIQVRIAVHTTDAEHRDGDLYGPGVNRCARLRSLAHPAQILLSEATAALVAQHLGPGERVRALGPHRLKDIAEPELVHQFEVDGLETSFPALREAEVDVRATTPLVTGAGPPAELVLPDGTRVRLAGRAATIGRLPTCDVALDDPSVSRAHAQVRTMPDGHVVVDLRSTNGLLVGDTIVTERLLVDGDQITLGAVTLVYRRL